MKILIAVVHHWNPNGGGFHQSLRPDPGPRVSALQEQLLSIRRLGLNQSVLNMVDRAVYRANDQFRHSIDVKVVTDGVHHVLDHLHPSFLPCFQEVATSPSDPLFLGFQAHKVLQDHLSDNYDLYCYLEDDLIIQDPCFFSKIFWFTELMGSDCILLPQRMEFNSYPHHVDRFYIDGPIAERELRLLIPSPGPVRLVEFVGEQVPFASPSNPHSGCFFLTHQQLSDWSNQSFWQDFDTSFISPLESAATLGIAKHFNLFKPCLSHAGWLEIQHYGTSFHSLIGEPFS